MRVPYKGGAYDEPCNYYQPKIRTGASLIAQELSEKLGVPVYDKAYIEHELDGDSYATEAEVIKELAEHPCIILGRCASEILKDQPNVFNVYVCADKEDRIERIMKKESLPHDEAKRNA